MLCGRSTAAEACKRMPSHRHGVHRRLYSTEFHSQLKTHRIQLEEAKERKELQANSDVMVQRTEDLAPSRKGKEFSVLGA